MLCMFPFLFLTMGSSLSAFAITSILFHNCPGFISYNRNIGKCGEHDEADIYYISDPW